MPKSASLRSVNTVPLSDGQVGSAPIAQSRNALLLQGPIGPFFSRFAEDLQSQGFRVTKVNFNGGDRLFYRRRPALDYTGKFNEWEAWLTRLLINCQIGRVYLFGDCRSYHRIARVAAKKLGIKVYVFEEGYIRPNFITLEEDGVNGHSTLMERPFRPSAVKHDIATEMQQPGHVFKAYSCVFNDLLPCDRRKP